MKSHQFLLAFLALCLLPLGCGSSQPPGGPPEPDLVVMGSAMTVKRFLKRAKANPANAEKNLLIMLESLDSDAELGGQTAVDLRDAAVSLKSAYAAADEAAIQTAMETLSAKANEINPEPLDEDIPE